MQKRKDVDQALDEFLDSGEITTAEWAAFMLGVGTLWKIINNEKPEIMSEAMTTAKPPNVFEAIRNRVNACNERVSIVTNDVKSVMDNIHGAQPEEVCQDRIQEHGDLSLLAEIGVALDDLEKEVSELEGEKSRLMGLID